MRDIPNRIMVGSLQDEALLSLVERVGSSSVELIMSKEQYTLIQQKMIQQTDGSWRRRDTIDVPAARQN